jgi:lipopolysaccharide heptosyltransferase II
MIGTDRPVGGEPMTDPLRRPPRIDAEAWRDARRILAIRLDTLGDVLMTTPAIRALRESAPGRSVTMLTSPGGAEAARLVPEIDDVIEHEAAWMKASAPTGPPATYELVRRLKAGRFDAAVIFTTYTQSPLPAALICHLAAVPLRLAHCRENPYQLLTDWLPETEPDDGIRHEVRRQLDLVGGVGATTADERLSLAVPLEADAFVTALVQAEIRPHGERWLVIHVGASAPSRRYEHFAEAARSLASSGWTIVFTGGRDEEALVEGVRRDVDGPTVSLAGRLSLPELAALIDAAPVLVSNNTGPVHVAAAVGTPVVDLYALTNPQHTPWQVDSVVLSHDVPCRNCYRSVCPMGHHDCLRKVPASAVVDAVAAITERDTRTGLHSGAEKPGAVADSSASTGLAVVS